MTLKPFGPAVPPFMPIIDQLGAHAEYSWNNATDGALLRIRHTYDRFRVPVIVQVQNASGTLAITYAGLQDGLRHGLTFVEEAATAVAGPIKRHLEFTSWRKIRELAQHTDPGVDLLMIGVLRTRLCQVARESDLIAPMRIHYVVHLGSDMGAIRGRVTSELRRRMGKGERQRGWTFENCTDEPAFWEFYNCMHIPTMQARHGGNSRAESARVTFFNLFRKGMVSFVREGSYRIAGVVCRLEKGGRLSMRSMGILGGDDTYYQSGASTALYILLLEWAEANGFREVELSGSEPFVNKGLFQFKRRFDPEIVVPNTHYRHKRLLLRPFGQSPLGRELLQRNPVICEKADGGFEAVFIGEPREAEKRLGWKTANIASSRVLNLATATLQ